MAFPSFDYCRMYSLLLINGLFCIEYEYFFLLTHRCSHLLTPADLLNSLHKRVYMGTSELLRKPTKLRESDLQWTSIPTRWIRDTPSRFMLHKLGWAPAATSQSAPRLHLMQICPLFIQWLVHTETASFLFLQPQCFLCFCLGDHWDSQKNKSLALWTSN